jgi:two-component system LytT family response regulator
MKVLIVDDESKARLIMSMLLNRITENIVIVEADSVKSAISRISTNEFDIIFLDVQLSDGLGFDVLTESDNIKSKVVFTTAFQDYAIRAIKNSAFEYLLKPICQAELELVLEKYNKAIETTISDTEQGLKNKRSIVLKSGSGYKSYLIEDIMYVQASANYSKFVFQNGNAVTISKTLKTVEMDLGRELFVRCHNSYLVNMKFVIIVYPLSKASLSLINGEQIPVSRRKHHELLVRFGN